MAKTPADLDKASIYGEKKYMAAEIDRLNKAAISKDSSKAIHAFLNDMKTRGLSIHRQYFYATKLRLIAGRMGSSFLHPSREDIHALMSYFEEEHYANN